MDILTRGGRLHGIEVEVAENDKSSVSHGRVLDADSRSVDQAELFARRLALKAASACVCS